MAPRSSHRRQTPPVARSQAPLPGPSCCMLHSATTVCTWTWQSTLKTPRMQSCPPGQSPVKVSNMPPFNLTIQPPGPTQPPPLLHPQKGTGDRMLSVLAPPSSGSWLKVHQESYKSGKCTCCMPQIGATYSSAPSSQIAARRVTRPVDVTASVLRSAAQHSIAAAMCALVLAPVGSRTFTCPLACHQCTCQSPPAAQ